MRTQRNRQQVRESQVGSDQGPVLGDRLLQDLRVRLAPQTNVANILGVEPAASQRSGEGTRQVLVHEKPGQSADRANVLCGDRFGGIAQCRENVFALEVVLLGDLLDSHAAGKLPHDEIHGYTSALYDGLTESNPPIRYDARCDLGHLGHRQHLAPARRRDQVEPCHSVMKTSPRRRLAQHVGVEQLALILRFLGVLTTPRRKIIHGNGARLKHIRPTLRPELAEVVVGVQVAPTEPGGVGHRAERRVRPTVEALRRRGNQL